MCANCCYVSGYYWFWTHSCTPPRTRRGEEVVWLLSQTLAATTVQTDQGEGFSPPGSLLKKSWSCWKLPNRSWERSLCFDCRMSRGETTAMHIVPTLRWQNAATKMFKTRTEPLLLLCICFFCCNKWWDQLNQHRNWLRALLTLLNMLMTYVSLPPTSQWSGSGLRSVRHGVFLLLLTW